MKLASWNVNGLRAVLKKGALQDFLTKEQPDVLCLQEIKAKPDQVDLALPGYTAIWNSAERPGYAGIMVLTKIPPESTAKNYSADLTAKEYWQDDPYGSPLTEGRVQTIEFPDFYLVNVYTPNAKPDLSRLPLRAERWDPAFLTHLGELEKTKPVITCGDFNAAHTEIDLARPKNNTHSAGFTPEERQGITNLLNAGFIDTFRQLHPDEIRYTWWSHWGNARANNVGWRIDYFFISENLLPNLTNAAIYEHFTGSDHCPISITINEARSSTPK